MLRTRILWVLALVKCCWGRSGSHIIWLIKGVSSQVFSFHFLVHFLFLLWTLPLPSTFPLLWFFSCLSPNLILQILSQNPNWISHILRTLCDAPCQKQGSTMLSWKKKLKNDCSFQLIQYSRKKTTTDFCLGSCGSYALGLQFSTIPGNCIH